MSEPYSAESSLCRNQPKWSWIEMSRELEKCLINCKTKMESLLQSSIASENDRPLESGQGWCFSKMMQFSWYCTVICCFDTLNNDPGWPVWRWYWAEWKISKSCLYILYSSTSEQDWCQSKSWLLSNISSLLQSKITFWDCPWDIQLFLCCAPSERHVLTTTGGSWPIFGFVQWSLCKVPPAHCNN